MHLRGRLPNDWGADYFASTVSPRHYRRAENNGGENNGGGLSPTVLAFLVGSHRCPSFTYDIYRQLSRNTNISFLH